jgi:AcrR family transcriptional regulator
VPPNGLVTGHAAEGVDPRIVRTSQACRGAIVELASERPISQVTIAELAERAGVTRATIYNHYDNPLEVLIQVLLADLEAAHELEEKRRAEGGYSGTEMLHYSIVDVSNHIERFAAVYKLAVNDPADGGVYEALVRHFTEYASAFIARCTHPDLPDADHGVMAKFLAHGFAGAIRAWLSDSSVTKDDMISAAEACAPAWWS